MRLSHYGWCAVRDCGEEATKRWKTSFGDSPTVLIPLCSDHLAEIKVSLLDLENETLVIANLKIKEKTDGGG